MNERRKDCEVAMTETEASAGEEPPGKEKTTPAKTGIAQIEESIVPQK